jgi:hypothetical protein
MQRVQKKTCFLLLHERFSPKKFRFLYNKLKYFVTCCIAISPFIEFVGTKSKKGNPVDFELLFGFPKRLVDSSIQARAEIPPYEVKEDTEIPPYKERNSVIYL